MEHSHRGKEYEKVHDEAIALIRENRAEWLTSQQAK